MNHLVGPIFRPLRLWAAGSQRRACRNAMVAATALTATRRERDETQEFIDSVLAHRARPADSAAPTLPAVRLG